MVQALDLHDKNRNPIINKAFGEGDWIITEL